MSQGTLIGIDQLVLGATANCDLKDLNGKVAIATGTQITPQLLDRIKAAGVVGLVVGRSDYVSHHVAPRSPGFDAINSRITEMRRRSGISDPLTQSTRNRARESVYAAFSAVARGTIPDIDALSELVDDILHSIELIDTAPLPDPRSKHESYKDRLVDSAIDIAVLLGWHLRQTGEPASVIRDAALGGLLHDVGLVLVQRRILEHPSSLSHAYMQEIKRHPYLGIRALSPLGKNLPTIAQDVILLHHEREDGRGYPLKRSGEAVPSVAKLAHILDAYVALVSPRPHRDAYTPCRAIEILLKESGRSFHRATLRDFIARTGRYPRGSAVLLSTNEVGIVVGQGKGGPLTPVVDIYFSRQLNFSQTAQRVDLGRDLLRYVRRVIK